MIDSVEDRQDFGSAEPETHWIDTHAHLSDRRLRDDLESVLERARAAGVVRIVSASTTLNDSRLTLGLAERFPAMIAPAVGIHCNDAAEAGPDDWAHIVELAARPDVVAIGETGLDRYWDRTPFPLQQDYFQRHLDLARDLGRPVIIHCRDCYPDIIEQLGRQGRPISGVLHSFTGTWDDAEALLALGLHLSFAGMVTFTSRALDALREVASRAPADRLLVETDSPYLSPHPFRGKPNEPARVALTGRVVAEARGLDAARLAALTTANARRLFGLAG